MSHLLMAGDPTAAGALAFDEAHNAARQDDQPIKKPSTTQDGNFFGDTAGGAHAHHQLSLDQIFFYASLDSQTRNSID